MLIHTNDKAYAHNYTAYSYAHMGTQYAYCFWLIWFKCVVLVRLYRSCTVTSSRLDCKDHTCILFGTKMAKHWQPFSDLNLPLIRKIWPRSWQLETDCGEVTIIYKYDQGLIFPSMTSTSQKGYLISTSTCRIIVWHSWQFSMTMSTLKLQFQKELYIQRIWKNLDKERTKQNAQIRLGTILSHNIKGKSAFEPRGPSRQSSSWLLSMKRMKWTGVFLVPLAPGKVASLLQDYPHH